MAINDKLIIPEAAAAGGGGGGTGNQEEGLQLLLDANDVDSYDGDGDIWYDIANFEYTPATNVSEHFNTVLHSGNSTGTTRQITGVGFQPDLVITKARNATQINSVYDSVRGVGNGVDSAGERMLATSLTIGQSGFDGRVNGYLSSFDLDGFTATKGTGAGEYYYNRSGYDYVSWCFKAGGAAVSNTDGDLNSNVSANVASGFSIVKGIGGSITGGLQSVGHGLDCEPEFVMVKNINSTDNWFCLVPDLTSTNYYIRINTTDAEVNNGTPTIFADSTTVSFRQNSLGAWGDLIAYCFASKRGVSKVGSFVGTGAAGKKITLDFEPSWILTKRTSSAGSSWAIIDNKTSTGSNKNNYLQANSSAAEATSSSGITFNTDGFTFNGSSFNTSGATHMYYAIAKDTNETSLIPDTNLELGLDAVDYSGSGNWLDSSGNGNNGTITGATWEKELGNSFDFDGSDDYVNTGSSTTKALPMSVEMWINPGSSLSPRGVIYSNFDGGTTNGFFIRLETSGKFQIDCYNKPAGTYYRTLINQTGSALPINQWSHCVFTFDTGYVKAYLNGDLDAQVATNSQGIGFTSSFDTLLARRAGGDYFNGKIGQVRVYDATLTQAQVRQNFNFTKPRYPNGNNGLLGGGTSSYKPTWNSGGYFQFDGSNDYVNLTGQAPFSNSTTQTDDIKCFTGWVKLDAGTRAMLYTASSTTNGDDYFSCQIRNTSPFVFVQGRDGTAGNQFQDIASYTPNTDWHHYVFQLTDTTREIYIDGVSRTFSRDNRGSATNTSWVSYPSYNTATTHAIQQGRASAAYYGTGKVSKVKYYSRPLTQAEITALYNEGE